MDKPLKTKITYEISQIDELIDKAGVLVSLCKDKEPDFIEITAVGGILHSFYNGIENIFVLIGKSLNFDFASSFGYTIKWEKCSYLFLELPDFWKNVRQSLLNYCEEK